MSCKRKVEWIAASESLRKAVKSYGELLFSLELEIVQSLSSLKDDQDFVWIRKGDTFYRGQVVTSTMFKRSNQMFVVHKHNETGPFLDSSVVHGKIETHNILPARLGCLTEEETLEIYQAAAHDFDLVNMKFYQAEKIISIPGNMSSQHIQDQELSTE